VFGSVLDKIDSDRIDSDIIDSDRIEFRENWFLFGYNNAKLIKQTECYLDSFYQNCF